MENMSVLKNQHLRSNYCFQAVFVSLCPLFLNKKMSLVMLFCVSQLRFSMLFQPLNTHCSNSHSGMLEQHWWSYICRHECALCCRSPKPGVNQETWSGSYLGLAKLKAKYTLQESKWLYLQPNPMNSLFRKRMPACMRCHKDTRAVLSSVCVRGTPLYKNKASSCSVE